jgi:hypothetical protein
MASHFIAALKIPSLQTTKGELRKARDGAATVNNNNNAMDIADDDEDESESFDVDTNMDVEASGHEAAAIKETSVTSFQPSDIVGKIMAFISQLRSSSESIREYLKKICISRGCPPLEIKIWVRTRWGSLSDCFYVILSQKKVCQVYYTA